MTWNGLLPPQGLHPGMAVSWQAAFPLTPQSALEGGDSCSAFVWPVVLGPFN